MEIIAEIANAHQGNKVNALNLASAAFKANAHSVKFQIYFAYEFLSKKHKRYEHFKKQSFNQNQWDWIIKSLRRKYKKKFIYADVFGLDALKLAIKLNLDGIKIHSSDLSNLELINHLKNYKKKIFISCGGSTLIEIYNVINFLPKKNIILLHGFQSYPTSIEDANFKKLRDIKNFFGDKFSYGYQDHTSGGSVYNIYLCLISLGYNIQYLEKHITFDRKKKGVDYFSSLEPAKFKSFVNIILKASRSINKKNLWFSKRELTYRDQVKKNWVAIKNIEKDQRLSFSNIKMLRHPHNNINPLNLKKYINKKILYRIEKNNILTKKNFKQKICLVVVARSKSSRFDNKAIKKMGDSNVLDHLFKRVKKLENINKIIFCTTQNKEDIKLCKIAKKNNIDYFKGSTLNVLDRIMKPLSKIKPDIVVRVTGDDILIDNYYFQKSLDFFLSHNFDYVEHKKLIGGTETEIFDYEVLKFIYNNFKDLNGTEYLTNYIKNNLGYFNIGSSPVKKKHLLKNISMTIDTKDEYNYVKKFINWAYKKNKNYLDYTYDDIITYCKSNPQKYKKTAVNLSKVDTTIKKINLISNS